MGGQQKLTCRATIQPVAEGANVNVRGGAGRHYPVVAQLPAGVGGIAVLDVKPDEAAEASQGRVFQWLQLALPDEMTGWVRDDLIVLEGDCTAAGYSTLTEPTRADTLTPSGHAKVEAPTDDLERVRRAAFAITAGYEGRGYDSYQNTDSGIVSFGRFQFTLASGSLEKVLERYLEKASGPSPDLLRKKFFPRVQARDPALRDDAGFQKLLLGLAADPVMQAAQDSYATETFWNTVMKTSMMPRGIKTPLGQAFVFDMAINHGAWGAERTYLRGAEQVLGVEARSPLVTNGLTEAQLLTAAAQIRRDRLHALANARGWGGLKPRADFWLERMNAGDWQLQGDDAGEVAIRPDKSVQVRKPL